MNAARLLLAAAVTLAACSRPEPPEIRPISAKVSTISPSGVDVQAALEGYNPNDFDLVIKSAKADITIDGKANLGTASAAQSIKLPAKQRTKFNMPIAITWSNVIALVPIATGGRDVPYKVEGKAQLEKPVDIEVPFELTGTLTNAQIQQAVGSAVPKMQLPSLPF